MIFMVTWHQKTKDTSDDKISSFFNLFSIELFQDLSQMQDQWIQQGEDAILVCHVGGRLWKQ